LGHNQPSFDEIVQENLKQGILWAQRDSLVRVIRDPKLTTRHRIILAEIIMATNRKTGVAFPGRAYLAEATGYSETTVSTAIWDLSEAGYLASERRAPERGRRALAHYAVIKPTVEELQAAITAHVIELRKQREESRSRVRNGDRLWRPEFNPAVEHRNGAEINPGIKVNGADFNPVVEVNRGADFNPVVGADFNPVVETVTSNKITSSKKPPRKGDWHKHKFNGTGVDHGPSNQHGHGLNGRWRTDKAIMLAQQNPAEAEAQAQVARNEFGDIEISEEFRAYLGRTYTPDVIEDGTKRAAGKCDEKSDAVWIRKKVLECCSYASTDRANKAGKIADGGRTSSKQVSRTYEIELDGDGDLLGGDR
jgi:hypothetical protein